jgi:hypothetical protein
MIVKPEDGGKKKYRRDWQLKKKYGMEFGEFEELWYICQGKCFICKIKMKWPASQQGQALDVVAVDHDHKTNKVRGLLCNACNKGLGLFKDDINLLDKAIKYLCGN